MDIYPISQPIDTDTPPRDILRKPQSGEILRGLQVPVVNCYLFLRRKHILVKHIIVHSIVDAESQLMGCDNPLKLLTWQNISPKELPSYH